MKELLLILLSLIFLGCESSNSKKTSVNIEQNQKISSPLAIELNSNSVWFAHEGELGSVTLVDKNGDKLGIAILSVTDGNWISDEPLTSKITLNFKIKNSQSAKLIFRNNNPSMTEGVNKEFTIDVLLEKAIVQDLLVGDWYQLEPKRTLKAFTLRDDGTAKSLTMATLLYKNYKRVGDEIVIFSIQSIGNGSSSIDEYPYYIEYIDNDKMILRYLDNGKKSSVKEVYTKSHPI